MRKYLKLCVLVIALAALMMLPAFAGSVTATKNDSVDGAGLVVKDDTDNQQFTASYSKATGGGQYLVLMVKGGYDSEQEKYIYEIDEDSADDILYVDQVQADSTTVSFTLYPSAVTNSVVLLAGEGLGTPVVLGSVEVAGVEVSGTVTSWNNTDDAVIRLYEGTMTDEDIKADITSVSPTGIAATKDSISANADAKRYDQSISFEAVTNGSYKLAIYKPGKYVVKIIEVTVSGSAVELGELKLWLYGDVNYDGTVNATDATQVLRRYNNKTPNAFTASNAEDIPDRTAAADVNLDGYVNATDATQILRYYNSKTPNAFSKY